MQLLENALVTFYQSSVHPQVPTFQHWRYETANSANQLVRSAEMKWSLLHKHNRCCPAGLVWKGTWCLLVTSIYCFFNQTYQGLPRLYHIKLYQWYWYIITSISLLITYPYYINHRIINHHKSHLPLLQTNSGSISLLGVSTTSRKKHSPTHQGLDHTATEAIHAICCCFSQVSVPPLLSGFIHLY